MRKRLWTDAGDGELIVGYVADNRHDGRASSREIDAVLDASSDDATSQQTSRFFYRITTRRRAVEEVFIRAGIPAKVVGGVRFYERKGDS